MGIFLLESKLFGYQVLGRVKRLGHPQRRMPGSVAEDVIQLVGQDSAYRASISDLTAIHIHRPDFGTDKAADLVTIDVTERENGALAHMCPSQGTSLTGRMQVAVHFTFALEG